jgi:hypothetical protein
MITVNSDYFPAQHRTIRLYNDTDCVMCEAKTKLLYFNLLNFVLQIADAFSSVWIAVCLKTLHELQTL